MSRMVRFLVAASLGLTMSAGILAPVQSVAAASCGGSAASCDFSSPQTTGCSADAVTKRTTYVNNAGGTHLAKVELRHSPSCRTAWSRVTNLTSSSDTFLEIVVRQQDGEWADDLDVLASQQSGYSPQLYVYHKTARACGQIAGAPPIEQCTSWFAFP
jgi:hypothetical protein